MSARKITSSSAIIFVLYFAVLFFVFAQANVFAQEELDNLQNPLYVPSGINRTQRYPLLVILSPSGSPQFEIQSLKTIADKHKWILVGDRNFRNGIPMNPLIDSILTTIGNAQMRYPVDKNRIYIGGVSGGGMGSYSFIYRYPNLIRGIIANTGMMPFASDPPFTEPIPSDFPTGKTIVMLASPTDFRYKAMLKNKYELSKLHWNIKWIEFAGGHALAPKEYYDAAMTWLEQQR